METDYIQYVCKCFQCQVHADMIKVPQNKLSATSSPWPFAAWGMDVIGPIEHTASNGHRFVLVAIEYFTKWVEAASYKAVTNKVVADFVKDQIVCRFGVPESIVTDNAANLNSDLMKSMTFEVREDQMQRYLDKLQVEAQAFEKVREKEVTNFIWDHIICWFGIPTEIVFDRRHRSSLQNRSLRSESMRCTLFPFDWFLYQMGFSDKVFNDATIVRANLEQFNKTGSTVDRN
ncbi:uncharacterized protein [Nicotiana sylvestris]|uniref:uncharacterized protein n=1 Tax=Nicotiana sylvestris TaxID=4096 RepID=UPI00388C8F35